MRKGEENQKLKRINNTNLLYQAQFYMQPQTTEKQRTSMTLDTVVGRLGGLLKVLQSVAGMVTSPVASFLFHLFIIKQIFYAKTISDSAFRDQSKSKSGSSKRQLYYLDKKNIPDDLKKTTFKHDIKHHRHIRLSFKDRILLFLHFQLPCLKKISCWSKKDILLRMFMKAKRKVFKSLNVI